MEVKLINIGNSKGILIPAKILKLLGLKDKVRIEIKDDKMIIESAQGTPRADWVDRFKKSNSSKNHAELIPDVFEDEDFEDWSW
jgi:antitoxin MazE